MHLLERIKTQYPKIRENNPQLENELINYLIVLLNLKTNNEVENDNLQIQMIVILDFIKSKFGSLTTEEIKEAFKKYVAGDFNIKVFRILDCVVVGEVLNAFINYRAEILRTHEIKKPLEIMEISEEEKNRIVEQSINEKYNHFLMTGEIEEPISNAFKYLVECGNLKMPTINTPKLSEYYDKKLLLATEQIKTEYQSMTSSDKNERLKIKNILNAILENNHNEDSKAKIEIRAKKLVLTDYFENQKNKGLTKIFDL